MRNSAITLSAFKEANRLLYMVYSLRISLYSFLMAVQLTL